MTTPLSGTPDEITEHLAAAYRTDPTGTTLVLGHDWAQTVVEQLGNVIQERDDALVRLDRIAHAHVKHVDASGGTTGDCVECGERWPCPTSVWATTDRDPLSTWDPADDDPPAACPVGLQPNEGGPVDRCIVEGPHEQHVSALGKHWSDDRSDVSERPPLRGTDAAREAIRQARGHDATPQTPILFANDTREN